MGDPRIDQLTDAGWTRRGPFWSPPGSQTKLTLNGAVAHLAAETRTGPGPNQTWKKSAIVEWLHQAGADVDPSDTKTSLLEMVDAIR